MRIVNRMAFLLCLVAALFSAFTVRAAEKVEGKTFYTSANMWYESPDRIESTNYHRGAILPIGTKVKIIEMNDGVNSVTRGNLGSEMWDRLIRFTDERGISYKVIFISRHASPGMTFWDYFKQIFSENDPLADGGAFKSLTVDEQKRVKAGEIASGMSKKAVVMAYGYPPGHRTPSLDSDRWVYWENRFKTRAVKFSDNKVKDEARRKPVSAIDDCIRACKENTNRSSEHCFDDCKRER